MISITIFEAKVIIEALWSYITSMDEISRKYPEFKKQNDRYVAEAKLVVKRIERELEGR